MIKYSLYEAKFVYGDKSSLAQRLRKGLIVMSINDTLKKLKEDLAKTAADINTSLADPSITKEIEVPGQKSLDLLAEVQNNLQQMITKLDAKLAKGIPTSRVVDFLNELLETEYDAIFSYSYHALSVEDKQLKKELLDLGYMEMRHFELIRDKIVSFGVEPKWKLTKYMDCTSTEPIEFLRWHLKAEQAAIDLCKDGIAEGLDDALGGFLKETIKDEEGHIKWLKELIERFGSASPLKAD